MTAPAQMTPGLRVTDAHAAMHVARAVLLLRREVCWCWRSRRDEAEESQRFVDSASESLDLIRHSSEKDKFFADDPAARYLTEQIEASQRPRHTQVRRGGWAWLAEGLALDEASEFLLGLVVADRLDAAIGPVLATCVNDPNAGFVTLTAAQRLWSDPLAIAAFGDAAHPLFQSGILTIGRGTDGAPGWRSPIEISAIVARQLADADAPLPPALRPIPRSERPIPGADSLARYLIANQNGSTQIVPVIGGTGTDFEGRVAAVATLTGRRIAAVQPAAASDEMGLGTAAVVAWMRDLDLLLPEGWAERALDKTGSAIARVPVRAYVPAPRKEIFAAFPPGSVTPPLEIAPLSFEQRVELYKTGLSPRSAELDVAIDECSRRYRLPELVIERIIRTVQASAGGANGAGLLAACRTESENSMGSLAQRVKPRFEPGELVLPAKQQQQFVEIVRAMRALTEVHYRWGTAKAWNESGLTVLFAGIPGTGKSMGAESLGAELDLPMYRIDLSQVVNKYIGETEKNLKRIFDAAESSDCILFFDEADALFGKRTEVKDAHDRFANIEISYLLERMERFKGLAILATNRRKDLDEAFLRRLRFVIEFPLPGPAERERIWRQVFPPGVDVNGIDFPFLARQFSLTGGHIRSIAFAACLQSAAAAREEGTSERIVSMDSVLVAVKRELEKMNRAAGDGVFGMHGETIRGLAG